MKVIYGGSIPPRGKIRAYDVARIPGDRVVVIARPPGHIDMKSAREGHVELTNTHTEEFAVYSIVSMSRTTYELGLRTNSFGWLTGKTKVDLLVPFHAMDTKKET